MQTTSTTAGLHLYSKNVADETVQTPKAKTCELMSLAAYQVELKKHLPEEIFLRTPSRLLYVALFVPLNIAMILWVMQGDLPWFAKLALGILIGQCNVALSFLAHETMHGSIVQSKWIQDIVGFFGFAPFLVSPTYWRYWHNQLHHGNTQLIYKDPDAFPTIGVYKRSAFMRAIFRLTPGAGGVLSYCYFFYWFPFQATLNQAYMRFNNKMWEKMDHRRVTIEFIIILAMVGTYIWWVGAENFWCLVLVPFLTHNYTTMSYISTNHNISPLTKVNDPLVNSLTVTNWRPLEALHLNFGYHVEHHIFPRMSARHAKKVHETLKQLYPEKFKVMPKWKAIHLLYKSPRIYKSATELTDPRCGRVVETIQ